MHIFLIVYVLYVIVTMNLCVDFGASDCDCEECSYFPNYQGKWYFMNISIPCFILSIRNILLSLACYYFAYMPCWEILVVVELLGNL